MAFRLRKVYILGKLHLFQNTVDEDNEEETEDQMAQRLIKQLIEEQKIDDEAEDDLLGISRSGKTSKLKKTNTDEYRSSFRFTKR